MCTGGNGTFKSLGIMENTFSSRSPLMTRRSDIMSDPFRRRQSLLTPTRPRSSVCHSVQFVHADWIGRPMVVRLFTVLLLEGL